MVRITDVTLVLVRTTVRLDDDVAAAAQRLQHERRIGLSEAVNELARAGLAARPDRKPFEQRTRAVGLTVDVSNVAEVLELIEDDERER